MKKYFITRRTNKFDQDIYRFHIFANTFQGVEKKKLENQLRQDYNIEVSYELLLDNKNRK